MLDSALGFSQVMTDDGISGYVANDDLEAGAAGAAAASPARRRDVAAALGRRSRIPAATKAQQPRSPRPAARSST